jgi:hypothetical protein
MREFQFFESIIEKYFNEFLDCIWQCLQITLLQLKYNSKLIKAVTTKYRLKLF